MGESRPLGRRVRVPVVLGVVLAVGLVATTLVALGPAESSRTRASPLRR
jgi:hypothetical protein